MRRRSDAGEHVQHAVEDAEEREETAFGPHGFRVRAGMTLSILAVILAVTALFVQRAIKSEITVHTDAAATRGSLETAQLLQAVESRSSQDMAALAQLPGLPESERQALVGESQAEAAAAGHEADDPQGGAGAVQLQSRLSQQTAQAHRNESRADRLEYGEVILEASLVLGSLSVLLLNSRLLLGAAGAAGLGVLVALTALLA